MTKEELNEILDEELQRVSPELAKAFRSIMPTLCALNAIVFADAKPRPHRKGGNNGLL